MSNVAIQIINWLCFICVTSSFVCRCCSRLWYTSVYNAVCMLRSMYGLTYRALSTTTLFVLSTIFQLPSIWIGVGKTTTMNRGATTNQNTIANYNAGSF